MNKLATVLVLVGFGLAAAPSFAQQEQGDSEVIFNGAFTSTFGDFGSRNLHLTGVYGYFYTKKSEFIGGLLGSVSWAGGTNANLGGLVGYRYNLEPRDKLVPYVGGDFFIFDFSPPEGAGFGDVVFANAQAGAKYYFSRNVAFDVNLSLGFGSTVSFNARFGLAYIFARGR